MEKQRYPSTTTNLTSALGANPGPGFPPFSSSGLESRPSVLSFQRYSNLRSSSKPETPPIPRGIPRQVRRNSMNETNIENSPAYSVMSAACAECVTDCREPSCPAVEITSECTDQCVVIACNDPTHGEMNCHEDEDHTNCDLQVVCDGSANCANCSGFDEFLQCCAGHHSSFAEPRNFSTESANMAFTWDSSLHTLFSSCGEQGHNITDNIGRQLQSMSTDTRSSSDLVNPPLLSSATGNHTYPISMHPQVPDAPSFPSQHYRTQSFSVTHPQREIMPCMWGDCHATFTSLSELVGHVNLQHLRLPAPIPSSTTSAIEPPPPLHHEANNVPSNPSCLWRDCNVNPSHESLPGPSSGNQANTALGVLASHLLQDHLGLPTRGLVPPAPSHARPDDGPMHGQNIPTPASSVHSASPPPHECSGTHVCHWRSCEQTFTSCDELTSHITTTHVGGGKAHYECYWEGCPRHGDHGFSSKQKICRHLQSHTGHRPFQCQVCKQNFSEAATLQQHMRRHTQEKPYPCDFPGCGKSFAITGALTIHKRTHNGHKPFKCSYCDKAFAESSNLSKHLRTHTGARPYECTESGCKKSFARPDQLARHMGIHRKKSSAAGGA